MKGLLVKDLKLISKYKRMAVIFLFVIVIMLFQQNINGHSFVIGYVTMLVGMISISTISMDENGKNLPFIMTMPITKKSYVLEKYILVMSSCLIGNILTMLFCIIVNMDKWNVIMAEGIILLAAFSLYNMIMIPLQLKYSDKSRIATFGVVAFFMVIYMVIEGISSKVNEADSWVNFSAIKEGAVYGINAIMSLNRLFLGIIIFMTWFLCMGLSVYISMRIIGKKEFC